MKLNRRELIGSLRSVDCSEVTLDCRLPHWFVHKDDTELNRAFGVNFPDVSVGFIKAAVASLGVHRKQLRGLTLMGFPDEVASLNLVKWGYKVTQVSDTSKKAVPPEYALFTAIKKVS